MPSVERMRQRTCVCVFVCVSEREREKERKESVTFSWSICCRQFFFSVSINRKVGMTQKVDAKKCVDAINLRQKNCHALISVWLILRAFIAV